MKSVFNILCVAILFLSIYTKSFAFSSMDGTELDIVVDKKQDTLIKPNSNEIIVKIHGVVCSFCSYGVQKKLSKLRFVDKTKYNKGSKVITLEQQVIIAIKSGETADLNMIFNAIQSGGYDPIMAYVTDINNKTTKYITHPHKD
jgi:hypothetical protein